MTLKLNPQNPFSIESIDRDFSIETKPYILSNESEREQTIKHLTETSAKVGGFHIGFSCWENFNFMIARGSDGALIADISNPAHEVHLWTKECILKSENRKQFLEMFIKGLNPDRHFREDDLTQTLDKNEEWLGSDASFDQIRGLYQKDRIHHIRMDITDRNAFENIANWIKANELHCDSFYLSNIPDWFINLSDPKESIRKLGQMKSAINRVIGLGTYVIHSSESFLESAGMPQRVHQIEQGIYDPYKVITKGI